MNNFFFINTNLHQSGFNRNKTSVNHINLSLFALYAVQLTRVVENTYKNW